MTGPVPSLPNVSLGNTASDIGSGVNTFVRGLLDQRQRASQLAMQQALSEANVSHLGAETGYEQAQTAALPAHTAYEQAMTGDVGAQQQQRDIGNAPASPEEHQQLKALSPHYIYDPSLTHSDAMERVKELTQAQLMLSRLQTMYGAQQGRFDQGRILDEVNRFNSDPEVKNAKGVASLYRNTKTLIAQGAPITQPSLLLDLGQALGMPGQPNARAIGTELANLLQGTGLTYSQRVQQFINKLTTEGDQFTLDPMSQAAIPEIIRNIATARMSRFDQLKSDAVNRVQTVLGVQIPDNVFGTDPYGDIRQELNQPAGAVVAPQPGALPPGLPHY